MKLYISRRSMPSRTGRREQEVDEPIEDIVDNASMIGEKMFNGISEWRFVESAVVPEETVLEISCHQSYAVNVLVVTVQKAAKEIY